MAVSGRRDAARRWHGEGRRRHSIHALHLWRTATALDPPSAGSQVLAAPSDSAVVRYVEVLGLLVALAFLCLLLRQLDAPPARATRRYSRRRSAAARPP